MPSPLINKQRESPLSRQLRSPRGSPRASSSSTVLPLVSRHFRYMVWCCFPLLLLLQWSITFTPTTTGTVSRNDLQSSLLLMHHSLAEESSRRHAPRHVRSLTFSTMKKTPNNNKQNNDLLESYNYAHHPIVPSSSLYKPHSNNPLPVILLGSSETKDPEQGGGLLDGLERSRYIKVIHDKHDWLELQQNAQTAKAVVVHLVDWAALDRDCHYLQQMYQDALQPASHRLVYFDTSASTRITVCTAVNALFHNQYRVVKQSIVTGRHWNARHAWVSTGQIMAQPTDGMPVLHAPHFLRESFVDVLLQAVKATTKAKGATAPKDLLAQIVTLPRKLDVVHVWRKGDASHYGRLRRQVSLIIQQLNGTELGSGQHSLRWMVRPRGDDDGVEKGIIQPEYVVSLLNSKIVVVAQRDEWEDHLRLMESLASGALVLTDTMLATPHGLKNGTSILTYHDATSLRNLILYYAHPDHENERIAIAQRGWEIAMGRHRSWHRMEQVLFGAARSKVDKPLEEAPPPRRQHSKVDF